jgi:hypothetical protein
VRSSSEVEKQAGDEGWKLKTRTSSLHDAPPREVFERSREASGTGGLDTQPPRTLRFLFPKKYK